MALAVKANKTEIKSCTCKNEYQDATYGESMRVMNSTSSGWRCTSCRTVRVN